MLELASKMLALQLHESFRLAIDKFLRWLSINVARQLKLAHNLDHYWDEDIGSKVSCTIYFEGYLLEKIRTLNSLNYACNWVRDYLRTNAEVEERDRHLCDRS